MSSQVVRTGDGTIIICDADALLVSYGAHAMRVDALGDIELLMAETEGSQWVSILEAELVQPASRTNKARKQ